MALENHMSFEIVIQNHVWINQRIIFTKNKCYMVVSALPYLTGVCAAVITHKHIYILKHGAKRIY